MYILLSQWSTVEVEIKFFFFENLELSQAFSFKLGLRKDLHASPTADNSSFLMSAFTVHSPSFFPWSPFSIISNVQHGQ